VTARLACVAMVVAVVLLGTAPWVVVVATLPALAWDLRHPVR
jgi:hypothetical protein